MLQLFRCKLSMMVALATAAGYSLVPGAQNIILGLQTCAGVFLLSAGCSALNQVQEQSADRLQTRTCRRPVASGQLSSATALTLALSVIIAGLIMLGVQIDPRPLGLGFAAVILYNGIYTPLKKATPFALLPGALAGASPALIGWAAAGGQLFDHRILLVSGLFILWQIPHSWFLGLRFAADAHTTPLAHILKDLSTDQLLRVARVWIVCLALAALLLPSLGIVSQPWVRIAIPLQVSGILGYALFLIRRRDSNLNAARLFTCLNGFMAGLLVCLLAEGLAAACFYC